MSALHLVAAHAHGAAAAVTVEPIVRLLLQHGADPTSRDSHGRTPADLARDERIRSLLAH